MGWGIVVSTIASQQKGQDVDRQQQQAFLSWARMLCFSPTIKKASYRLSLNVGKDFLSLLLFIFQKNVCVCVQTSREPAEDRGVFSEPDAPDEVHVCGLLFQPSICSQCAHTAQVTGKKKKQLERNKQEMWSEDTEKRCDSSKAY